MSFLSQKYAKNMKKWQKNGQKMAEIKNPFKVLLLTHFALYMPKIMGFGQKTKKRYHNCPTQQYMTGPFQRADYLPFKVAEKKHWSKIWSLLVAASTITLDVIVTCLHHIQAGYHF